LRVDPGNWDPSNPMPRLRWLLPPSALVCLVAFAPAGASVPPVRIRFVGDVAIVGTLRDEVIGHHFDPFAGLDGFLADADLAIANLEAVLTDRERPAQPLDDEEVPILRSPPRTAELLRNAGVDVVSLANNHALDFGPTALARTLGHVRHAGLTPVGAGTTPEEARALQVSVVRGVRVGIVAAASILNQHPAGDAYVARVHSVVERVTEARARVDLVVVFIHWGREYEPRPEPAQRQLAHALIDAGADAVIGHHPHVLQTVEQYRGKPIVYSLGNFTFGPQPAPRDVSAVAELVLEDGELSALRMIPVVLRGFAGSPLLSTGRQGERSRERLRPGLPWAERDGVLSIPLGTAVASR